MRDYEEYEDDFLDQRTRGKKKVKRFKKEHMQEEKEQVAGRSKSRKVARKFKGNDE